MKTRLTSLILFALLLVTAACSSSSSSSSDKGGGAGAAASTSAAAPSTSSAPSSAAPPSSAPASASSSAEGPKQTVRVTSLISDGQTYGIGMPIVLFFSPAPTDSTAFTKAVKVTVDGRPAN